MRTLIGIAAVALLAAPSPARAGTTVTHVHVIGSSFEPQRLAVLPGDSVEWDNHGSVTHTVTARGCMTGACIFDASLAPGASFTHAFEEAGVFEYTCRIHGFSGRVTVADATGTLPDLAVEALFVEDVTAFGAPLPYAKRLSATIANRGNATASETTLRFEYRYRGAWVRVAEFATPAVNVDGSATLHATWDTTAKAGDFLLRAVVDAGGALAESRESNNERWQTTALVTPPGVLPATDVFEEI